MFNSDKPIASHEEDLLGRHSFAKELAKAIVSYKQEESIALGLFGKWGSGKTSILNMVEEEITSISDQNAPKIIKFNPWNFSDQNQLISQFFKELSTALCRNDSSKSQVKLGRAIQMYAAFFEPLSYVPTLSFFGAAIKIIKKVGEATEKAGKFAAKNLSEVKKDLNKLLRKIDIKLIIIIDDIDRLNSTEIRQIFQLVKSLADFPNTIYLLTFDRDVVVKALTKVQEGDGSEYLEKVVQVPFEIPDISRSELEKYFFGKLIEHVKETPENKWDQNYWANVYLDGLKYLFRTMRDVNRFFNVFGFVFCFVKDEINPIDFIAITAVQVFMPELYYDIKDNKDVFIGIRDYHDPDAAKNEEQSRARIEKILNRVRLLPQGVITDFLERLFPRISKNHRYNHSFLNSWHQDGRICSPDVFDTYFKLRVPKGEIPRSEIDRILSTGNDIEAFSSELIKLSQESKVARFLERMEDYTRDVIPVENIRPMIISLMDVGDLFPNERADPSGFSIPIRILRIFYQLSERVQDQEKRFEIFKDAILHTERSIYTIVNEIGTQCSQHGICGFDIDESTNTPTVSSVLLKHLVMLALEKIEKWASSGKLRSHQDLRSILYVWRRWKGHEHVNLYVRLITQDDNGLVAFLPYFLNEIRSWGGDDIIPKVSPKIELKNLSDFVELDEIDKRIRTIKSSSKINEFCEREKLAIDIFIDTRDGKIKNEF